MLRASVALWSVRVRIAVLACKRPAEPDLSEPSQLGGTGRTGVGPGLGRNFRSLPRRVRVTVTIIMMMVKVTGRCPRARRIPWQFDGPGPAGSDAEWGPDSEPATGTGLH
jgi:hypothetical protein